MQSSSINSPPILSCGLFNSKIHFVQNGLMRIKCYKYYTKGLKSKASKPVDDIIQPIKISRMHIKRLSRHFVQGLIFTSEVVCFFFSNGLLEMEMSSLHFFFPSAEGTGLYYQIQLSSQSQVLVKECLVDVCPINNSVSDEKITRI